MNTPTTLTPMGAGQMTLPTVLQLINDKNTSQDVRARLYDEAERLRNWSEACQSLPSPSEDEFTTVFHLNTLLKTATFPSQWESIPERGKGQIKEALLMATQQGFPAVKRRKAAQVLVAVFKREYFTRWAEEFLDHVQDRTTKGDTTLLWACCENLTSQFEGAAGGTGSAADKRGATFVATKVRAKELSQFVGTVVAPRLVSSLAWAMKEARTDESFKGAQALINWIPLEHVTFDFAMALFSAPSNSLATATQTLGVLVGRNYVPQNAEAFIESVAAHAFSSLRDIPKEVFAQNPDFASAMLEFIAAFVQRHFGRAESKPGFSVTEFLRVFYEFTFSLSDPRLFLVSLNVWDSFIDHVAHHSESSSSGCAGAPVLGPLLVNLLERFLFCKSPHPTTLKRWEDTLDYVEESEDGFLENDHSAKQLSDNFGGFEDDNENKALYDSDLTYFIFRVVALIRKVAALPAAFGLNAVQVLGSSYQSMEQQAVLIFGSGQVGMHAARDVSTFFCVFQATSPLYTSSAFRDSNEVKTMATWILEILPFLTKERAWSRGFPFVLLHGDVLRCCTGFVPWAMDRRPEYVLQCTELAVQTLRLECCPESITEAALNLLEALPPSVWLERIALIAGSLSDFSVALSDHVRGSLYRLCALKSAPNWLVGGLEMDCRLLRELCGSALPEHTSKVRRSLVALTYVATAARTRPETTFKKAVFDVIGFVGLESSLQSLEAVPPRIPKEALGFLYVAFSELRRQIGDETCGVTIGRCLTSAGRLDKKFQPRVLQLMLCVVEENSKSFENLLPDIMQFVLGLASSMLASGSASDDYIENLSLKILHGSLKHWLFFFQPGHESRIELFQNALGALFARIDPRRPPDIVRYACQALVDLHSKRRLFALDPASEVCARVVCMIAKGERDFILDDLLDVAWAAYSANPEAFHNAVLPEVYQTLGLTPVAWGAEAFKNEEAFQQSMISVASGEIM